MAAAAVIPGTAGHAFEGESGLLGHSPRRLVVRVDDQSDPVDLLGGEQVAAEQRHRLGREPSTGIVGGVDDVGQLDLVEIADGLEELDVPNLFWRFFKHIKNSAHNLIVLRSGYLVDALTKKSDDRLAEEKEAIRKAYKKIPHHGTFTYATLREDKLLKGCVAGQEATPQADKHSALLIATFGERPKTNPPRLWVFQNKGALDGSTGIKVTFLHHAADSASPSSRSIKRRLSQPLAENPTDGHHGDPPDASILDVAPVEVEILGQIWKDGHLELYDTKWPIPTHLAQLASDRALIHVVTNDWENQTETTPVYLTKVYKDVRNTLYYV